MQANSKNIWKFYRKETGQFEDVTLEKWVWEATYIDNTSLKQFDDNGRFHQVGEIEQAKLIEFCMRDVETGKTYTLLFDAKHWKLIHFYKRIGLDFMNNLQRMTLYIFGYETQVDNLKLRNYNVITPTGELIQTNDLERIQVA